MLRNKRPPNAKPGQRERNKQRKLEKLETAARALFAKKGFEDTTTRAIAARAGVAAGTFFLYFKEKRDLLFHLFKTDASPVRVEAFAALKGDQPLVRELMSAFGKSYAYYGKNPQLSRVFFKELLFLEQGTRSDMMGISLEFVMQIAELVAQAREKGEVDVSVDPLHAAAHIFGLYCLGLVAWLNGLAESREIAEAQVERQLELLMQGLRTKASKS